MLKKVAKKYIPLNTAFYVNHEVELRKMVFFLLFYLKIFLLRLLQLLKNCKKNVRGWLHSCWISATLLNGSNLYTSTVGILRGEELMLKDFFLFLWSLKIFVAPCWRFNLMHFWGFWKDFEGLIWEFAESIKLNWRIECIKQDGWVKGWD